MSDEGFEKTETVVATLRQDIKGEEHMSIELNQAQDYFRKNWYKENGMEDYQPKHARLGAHLEQDIGRQPPQIEVQVGMLRENLEVLEKTIAELSDRIRPVLNESALLETEPETAPRSMSAVANAFWETNRRVFGATRNIQAILTRLEI
jgi:hypothetical protein